MQRQIDAAAKTISRNPATGAVIAEYPYQTPAEIERTLAANAMAAKVWRATPMAERVACYRRLAVTFRSRGDALALLVTSEMGKTLTSSHAEVEKCALALEWFAEHGPAILADEPVAVEGGDRVHVSFLPIGTVLAVMPWNFPLWQVIRAAGPIILSGNGLVLKHAANVMGCAYALQAAYEASGFPGQLFATLSASTAAVDGLIADPRIAAVTVTGSMRAGSAVAAAAGRALKKSLLELGGADAFIVLADADLDKAVQVGIEARFENAGQICLAAKRFILERPIAEAFKRMYVEAASKVKASDPLDPASTIGPIARDDLRDGSMTRSSARSPAGPSCCSAAASSTVRATSTRPPCWPMWSRAWRRSMRKSSGRWRRSRSPTIWHTRSPWPTQVTTA
jgi:succinate-semialdehyde dehydrogenase